MRIYPWGELPAYLPQQISKLEAHATVRSQTTASLTPNQVDKPQTKPTNFPAIPQIRRP